MLDVGATCALSGTRFGDVRWYQSVDSTNRVLLDLARSGAPEGVVVGAEYQTAGRGRLDRGWISPSGCSLLVSVLFRPRSLELYPLVSTGVALAAADACAEVAEFRPSLKWPNDLVATVGGTDCKLAGLLAEAVADGSRVSALVVGMGLNVHWPEGFPTGLAGTATTLTEVAGKALVDRRALLVCFLTRLDERYGDLDRPGGWDRLLADYRAHCSTLGRQIRVELPAGATLQGQALEVTDDGRLVVEEALSGARHLISVGDVVHLRAPAF